MSMRYPGGLIASSPVNAAYPSGVWTQAQTQPYAAQNVWMRDQYWPYTTLLLQGNGTNGAQNNTFLDSSTNNFTITRNGNTTQGSFTPYEANGYWSNYFDGSTSYLEFPAAAANVGSGNFTIEFWYNGDVGSNGFTINTAAFNTSNTWQLFVLNNQIYWQNPPGSGNVWVTQSVGSLTNGWHHIAVVRSSGVFAVYVDGVSIAISSGSYTDSTNYSAASYLRIGARSDSVYAKGYFSNVRIVVGTAIYTAAFTPPTTPLTAVTNTRILTCQSNRFVDNSTNAYAVTVTGSPSVQAFQPFPGATTWSGSVLGGSGYFDGSGDYLTAPSDAALAVGSTFTVECWVYRTVGSTVQWIAGNNAGSGSTSWLLEIEADNTVYGGGWTTGTQTSSTVPVAAWTHIAMVCNSGSLKIYINGVQSGTAATSIDFTTSATTYIGRYSGGTRNLTGYISNLRVLKGTALYTADFTPPTSPLTAITNTSLLLNFTNAGIFDSAMMNDLETVGNAQVSTSVVKYGTGSMAFDGSGDYLKVPITSRAIEFKTGDFTVEGWFYNTASWSSGLYDLIESDNNFAFYMSSGNFRVTLQNQTAVTVGTSSGLSSNAWHHIALVKSSGNLYLYKNGILDSTGAVADARNYGAEAFKVGTGADGTYTGYIDDLRITKGAARYIGNFTPPVARMPGQ